MSPISSFFTYVTNFNSDKFYKIYQDDNVLSDIELKEVNYNTSYNKTAIERRNKINFLRHNNVAVISRVERHLGDKIFDSPLLKDIWKDKKIKYEDELEMPTFTTEAAYLYSSTLLNKSGIPFDSNVFNSYDPTFKQINAGDDFRKATWSVTGLESYINCPFKYYISKLIPLEKNNYSKRFIGTAIHKVFEKFNHLDYVFEDALKEGEQAYYQEFEKVGITPTPKDKAFLEISQMWLRRFVKSYQKAIEGTNFAEPVEDDFERSINFHLDEGKETYNFYGKIDKIFVTESNGHQYYSIVDYKTGAEEFNPLEVFLGKSIQLPLYYYAIKEDIQPDRFTKGAEFGGFYIQHVSFSTIKGALKETNGPYLKEKRLLQQSRLGGINKDSTSYIASIDSTAIKDDGSINRYGGELLQLKHQFIEEDGNEIIIKDDDIGLSKYNLDDLVKDAKEAAIGAIHKICEGDFPIAPTSYSLLDFDSKKTVCNNCPYRPVCYKSKDAAVDYRKEVLKHFKKGAK